MKLRFNKRKWFYLNKECSKSITIEVSGFSSHPSLYIASDGSDHEITLHIGFGIGLWITLSRLFPQSWYPKDYKEREIGLNFHHWSLWWTLWMDTMSWHSTDPKWRRGNIDFVKILKGKHNCEWAELHKESHIISFVEGNYQVEAIKKKRTDKWTRWFAKESVSWEVKAGYYNGGTWVECPIPVEGKGENSWDCDEAATYSSNFPAKIERREINTCYQAAMYFERSMKESREKRGGPRWVPQAYKEKGIELILKHG